MKAIVEQDGQTWRWDGWRVPIIQTDFVFFTDGHMITAAEYFMGPEDRKHEQDCFVFNED